MWSKENTEAFLILFNLAWQAERLDLTKATAESSSDPPCEFSFDENDYDSDADDGKFDVDYDSDADDRKAAAYESTHWHAAQNAAPFLSDNKYTRSNSIQCPASTLSRVLEHLKIICEKKCQDRNCENEAVQRTAAAILERCVFITFTAGTKPCFELAQGNSCGRLSLTADEVFDSSGNGLIRKGEAYVYNRILPNPLPNCCVMLMDIGNNISLEDKAMCLLLGKNREYLVNQHLKQNTEAAVHFYEASRQPSKRLGALLQKMNSYGIRDEFVGLRVIHLSEEGLIAGHVKEINTNNMQANVCFRHNIDNSLFLCWICAQELFVDTPQVGDSVTCLHDESFVKGRVRSMSQSDCQISVRTGGGEILSFPLDDVFVTETGFMSVSDGNFLLHPQFEGNFHGRTNVMRTHDYHLFENPENRNSAIVFQYKDSSKENKDVTLVEKGSIHDQLLVGDHDSSSSKSTVPGDKRDASNQVVSLKRQLDGDPNPFQQESNEELSPQELERHIANFEKERPAPIARRQTNICYFICCIQTLFSCPKFLRWVLQSHLSHPNVPDSQFSTLFEDLDNPHHSLQKLQASRGDVARCYLKHLFECRVLNKKNNNHVFSDKVHFLCRNLKSLGCVPQHSQYPTSQEDSSEVLTELISKLNASTEGMDLFSIHSVCNSCQA